MNQSLMQGPCCVSRRFCSIAFVKSRIAPMKFRTSLSYQNLVDPNLLNCWDCLNQSLLRDTYCLLREFWSIAREESQFPPMKFRMSLSSGNLAFLLEYIVRSVQLCSLFCIRNFDVFLVCFWQTLKIYNKYNWCFFTTGINIFSSKFVAFKTPLTALKTL